MKDTNTEKNLVAPTVSSEMTGEGFQIVKIGKGKLTYTVTQQVKQMITEQFNEKANGYVVDLAEVDFVDSTGFGVLINFAKKISVSEKKMTIIVKSPLVLKLIHISKFHLVFPVVDSREQAIQELIESVNCTISVNEY